MKINKNIAVSDSGFVFNPTTGESFSLNPIGLEIFQMLKDQKPFNEIFKTISLKYDIDQSSFEKDFIDFTQLITHYHLTQDAN